MNITCIPKIYLKLVNHTYYDSIQHKDRNKVQGSSVDYLDAPRSQIVKDRKSNLKFTYANDITLSNLF